MKISKYSSVIGMIMIYGICLDDELRFENLLGKL
jgi:hypothetical protein